MRAKKRVVTQGRAAPSGWGPAGSPAPSTRRTPTVRTIRSAIVEPRPGARHVSAPVAAPAPAVASAGPAADLSVDLGRGLHLRNPLLVASGTFGYGVEYADVVDIERLGAICCKGTTLRPRQGNRPPRVTETPAGMLNSIGLQNPGVDAVLERYAAQWAGWQVPVIVNVAGESIEDYVQVVRKLDLVPGIAGVELNISCPNLFGSVDYSRVFAEIHLANWNEPGIISSHFTLHKIHGTLETYFPVNSKFDLIYFDAFGPDAQPELWTDHVFRHLFAGLCPGGMLVTYSVKGAVVRALRSAGFHTEKLPGPPGKRHILRAVKI